MALSASERYLDTSVQFAELGGGLDPRIVAATTRLHWVHPTLVQSKAIPLALKGQDLLVRARTGSGKTAAYALSILQRLLNTDTSGGVRALALVPTRELAEQLTDVFQQLMRGLAGVLRVVGLFGGSMTEQAALLRELPDILVATPGRLEEHIKAGNIKDLQAGLQMLVIDEADLVLSHGHGRNVQRLVAGVPKTCQSMLLSATLNPAVEELKRLVLHAPAILKLEEAPTDASLKQFYIQVTPRSKYVLLYALIRLSLIAGKAIFFVNSLDGCYKLKLFLEAFSISAAVLNDELPANSRAHILAEFNRGRFDYLIATDEAMGVDAQADEDDSDSDDSSDEGSDAEEEEDEDGSGSDGEEDEEEEEGDGEDEDEDEDEDEEEEEEPQAAAAAGAGAPTTAELRRRRRLRRMRQDVEYSVARGVDFKGVGTVVNVDCPPSFASYTHRIGRTARGGASGASLTLVNPLEARERALLGLLQRKQPRDEQEQAQPALLPFDQREVKGFEYRVEGVERSITRAAVKEARLAELRKEIANSKRLDAHFSDNPRDLDVLQHEQALLPKRVRPHLATVPDYLLPQSIRQAVEAVGAGVKASKRGRKRDRSAVAGGAGDPLQSFAHNARRAEAAGIGKATGAAAGALAGGPGRSKRFTAPPSGRTMWKMRHKKGKFASAAKRRKHAIVARKTGRQWR